MHYRIGVLALMMVALPISASAQKLKKQEFPAYYDAWSLERIVPKGEKTEADVPDQPKSRL